MHVLCKDNGCHQQSKARRDGFLCPARYNCFPDVVILTVPIVRESTIRMSHLLCNKIFKD